ncbi:SLC13 family permease [Sediminitomix flava]|uniref:Di/tricarboxylate transporter n=1 Tax=Sediminitomix flava TaxID=379075 RepID=A0A315Z0I6_SEDFL|nr:SLC13 family permease [Sediminitomix flava]PWJ36177.1 di/tricarboxylate transporter [Sediminitomix flava]
MNNQLLALIMSPLTVQQSQWLVMGVMLFVIINLFLGRLKPSTTFFIAVMSLLVAGVVSPEQVLQGFANPQIITIILLILISSLLHKHYNVGKLLDILFKHIKSPKGFLLRMMVYSASLSSMINNTPVVAFMTSYVYGWGKKNQVPASKLLIPLSYATILGGMMTLVGTSTNLVLNGFIAQNNLAVFKFADFFVPGLLVTSLGIAYLYFWGYKLLPTTQEIFNEVQAMAPEYLIETEVSQRSVLVGEPLIKTPLQNFDGAYLIELHRGDEVISPIPEDLIVQSDDRLMYMGQTDRIMDIVNAGLGIDVPQHEEEKELIEALIPSSASFLRMAIDREKFKKQFDAEIIAIHRGGEKLQTKKNETVELRSGDLVLLSVGDRFFQIPAREKHFYILTQDAKEKEPKQKKELFIVGGIILTVVALMITGILTLFKGALLILTAFLLFRLVSFSDINKELDMNLVVVLVSALTLGNAFISTGTASILSNSFLSVFYPFGEIGILCGIFALTVLLTSFVTNVAAISIIFPIAYSIAHALGVDGTPFYLGIAFAASAAFLTPVSYQTNWMVYTPGNYTSKDFFRVGFPLTLIYTFTCIIFIIFKYDLVAF